MSERRGASGCRFHTRCPHAREVCRGESPERFSADPETVHYARCYRAVEDHAYWASEDLARHDIVGLQDEEAQADD